MVGYGRHSETARVFVSNDGLANLSSYMIQSGPFGNIGEQPFDGDKQMNKCKIILSPTGGVKSVLPPSQSTY